jgi:hypothetical protein
MCVNIELIHQFQHNTDRLFAWIHIRMHSKKDKDKMRQTQGRIYTCVFQTIHVSIIMI